MTYLKGTYLNLTYSAQVIDDNGNICLVKNGNSNLLEPEEILNYATSIGVQEVVLNDGQLVKDAAGNVYVNDLSQGATPLGIILNSSGKIPSSLVWTDWNSLTGPYLVAVIQESTLNIL